MRNEKTAFQANAHRKKPTSANNIFSLVSSPSSLRDRLQLLADIPFKRHLMDHPQGACLWHSHELTVLVLQPRILTIAMAADRADLVRRVLSTVGARAT